MLKTLKKYFLLMPVTLFTVSTIFYCDLAADAQTLNELIGRVKKDEISLKKPAAQNLQTAVSAVKSSTTGLVTDKDPEGLNVRSAPGGTVIGRLFYNDRVEIIAREGEWCKIKYKGGTAYVYGSYISGQAPPASAITPANPKTPSKDETWQKVFSEAVDPWVKEGVVFKFGGYDSLDEYKRKIKAGNRPGLKSDEYFEKYVDKKTWQYKSEEARREYDKIAGIDCAGFVQKIYTELCRKNGIEPPVSYKVSGFELETPKFSTRMKDDGAIPPKSAKPGDFISLKPTDPTGWGHIVYFAGRNASGTPMVVESAGIGKVVYRPMPDSYYSRYIGTYRFNEMDKIREKATAGI